MVKSAGISDEAVRAKTGKGWSEWFRILDRAGARKMDHRSIARLLRDRHIDSGWWAQMVTVACEQDRGLRDKHQKPSGYEISRSRTLPVSVSRLYGAWSDARARRRWLGETGLQVRKATAGKSMRITWNDGKTSLNVHFYGKGRGKSQVVVQHGKLASARQAERMKTWWGDALDRLKSSLD